MAQQWLHGELPDLAEALPAFAEEMARRATEELNTLVLDALKGVAREIAMDDQFDVQSGLWL